MVEIEFARWGRGERGKEGRKDSFTDIEGQETILFFFFFCFDEKGGGRRGGDAHARMELVLNMGPCVCIASTPFFFLLFF